MLVTKQRTEQHVKAKQMAATLHSPQDFIALLPLPRVSTMNLHSGSVDLSQVC